MDITQLLNRLINQKNLTPAETENFLFEVMKGEIASSQIAAILTALRIKGETPNEIFGFIQAMRKQMVKVDISDAIDVCGTGGDSSNSFNISTAVAFVVAGAGVKVAKHGNRAASSKCGSADVLEALGVNINISTIHAKKILEKVGMVFHFAPLFHPAIKQVTTVRNELKIRTMFNFFGPFINPAAVAKQLVGVPNKEIAEKLILIGEKLNYKHLLIVTSDDGMDEISLSAKTQVLELKNNKIKRFIIDPQEYGFKKIVKKDIQEGSLVQNANFIREILNGIKGSRRDIVVLNSAVAFYAADKVMDIKEGIKLAEESIDNGNAKKVLESLIKETQKYA
ncbi:MAG TPA: anthranilate phosphoribosyltransferase [Patescibacteria group bacterium]